jgi:hypothetical protein
VGAEAAHTTRKRSDGGGVAPLRVNGMVKAIRRWLLIGPLVMMAIGLMAFFVSSQAGWVWPPMLALALPNLLLALLIAGALAWLATSTRKGQGS